MLKEGVSPRRRGEVEPTLPASLAVLPGIKLTSTALSSLAVQRNKPLMSWSFACVMIINALAASHREKPPVAAILSLSHAHLNQLTASWRGGISTELFGPDVDADACFWRVLHCTNSPAYFNEVIDGEKYFSTATWQCSPFSFQGESAIPHCCIWKKHTRKIENGYWKFS